MPLNPRLAKLGFRMSVSLGILALTAAPGFSASTNNRMKTLGPEDASKQISVTVWLNPHNKAGLDAAVEQMYDKGSPSYHKFLTLKEYNTQFAPTAKDAATVRSFLTSHNMKVTSIDRNNHFVIAQGRVGDAQTAFNTKINRVMVDGVARHATTSAPSIKEPAASALVATVQGLSDLSYKTNVSPAVNPETRIPYAGVKPSAVGADGLFFSGECLRPRRSKFLRREEALRKRSMPATDMERTLIVLRPTCHRAGTMRRKWRKRTAWTRSTKTGWMERARPS